jgi:hypothetical protein
MLISWLYSLIGKESVVRFWDLDVRFAKRGRLREEANFAERGLFLRNELASTDYRFCGNEAKARLTIRARPIDNYIVI